MATDLTSARSFQKTTTSGSLVEATMRLRPHRPDGSRSRNHAETWSRFFDAYEPCTRSSRKAWPIHRPHPLHLHRRHDLTLLSAIGRIFSPTNPPVKGVGRASSTEFTSKLNLPDRVALLADTRNQPYRDATHDKVPSAPGSSLSQDVLPVRVSSALSSPIDSVSNFGLIPRFDTLRRTPTPIQLAPGLLAFPFHWYLIVWVWLVALKSHANRQMAWDCTPSGWLSFLRSGAHPAFRPARNALH